MPSKRIFIALCCLGLLIISFTSAAHNGKIATALPLTEITVDGDLSDWPPDATKNSIETFLFGMKPAGADDLSGFFQVGYRLENRSLYLAFTVMDDDFIEDTSANVRFNTQDCLELSLDARHLPFGSGVASFMYSKRLRNTNRSTFDLFAKAATWDIMEVAMQPKGKQRHYEWRIELGDQMAVGKSIGLDFSLFDKDSDSSFTANGWGRGGEKFRNPNSLGDILLVAAKTATTVVMGEISWDRMMKSPLPKTIRLTSPEHPAFWVTTTVDSTGKYMARMPPGKYELSLPTSYFQSGDKIYSAIQKKPITVTAKNGQTAVAERIIIPGSPVPDLLPAKGVLLNVSSSFSKQVDHFIQSYQDYYNIPGVSLALIKDGKLIYYKTYGYKNFITKAKVDSTTLFEAASITKPVFSFAVLRLAERGIIDLDRPLYLYLPYEDIAYDDRYQLITARHVLTHRTGFPNWRWMNNDQKLDLKFIPGTDYNYSGEGFEYLKMVVEKITGKKVEQVLKEEVLDPIGLYHTFFSKNDSLQRVVANGHFDGFPSPDDLPESPGMAYSMHTEARTFTKFMIYMLEQKGLSLKMYDTMLSKQSEYKYDPDEKKPKNPEYMGISLEVRETPFGKSFGHGGNNGDFRCHFEVYKDLKAGYVLFTNSNTSYPLIGAIRQFLIEGKQSE